MSRTRHQTPHMHPSSDGLVCMQMAQAGLEADDEQVAIDACEIFIDLIEAPAPVLGPSIPNLVRWCMKVALCTSYDLATREMALQASPAATLFPCTWWKSEKLLTSNALVGMGVL